MSGLRQQAPTVMTRAEFVEWMRRNRVAVYVWPYEVVPCHCDDHNCHGWRLVPRPMKSIAPITARESMMVEAHG